jgi:precorrin-2 dehydrogenase / sirohydrochlorin ferrochelatase
MNTLFPAFLNLTDQPCAVIGGGAVALRKIGALLECRARVRVIAPSVAAPIRRLFQERAIDLVERAYVPADLDGSVLVVAATDQPAVNAEIARRCQARQRLCNRVDDPEAGTFHSAPAYTCGDLKIAVSTNGASPALAAKIADDLAAQYPGEYAPYLQYLRRIRETVKEKISEESVRRQILRHVMADPGLLAQCRDEQFCGRLEHLDYVQEVEKWLSRPCSG